ncbi:hypothetical protein Ddye_001881 [Dipteronia dyeriana]|uniref:C2H2-type domain-containing protein n=1 Tax=Dipteronia dyeriana TaxID=168575 RepID=A0AAD9XPW7_9ROSI|nr:hypothetical protein Ddye_001881 [Dipteronia dyeriana]
MDSTEEEVKHNNSEMGFQENGQISYGLRENPKKSWKFSGFNHFGASSMQENQCKQCGKNFESRKALFGHMRHHSRKTKTRISCKECGKAYLSLKSLANHSKFHSDKSEVSDLAVKTLYVKKKRSKRKGYIFCATSSVSSLNESLSVTEIGQDVEHAARCLMMLSRGVRSLTEFSDNDIVAFEVESLNGNMKKPRDGELDDSCVSDKIEVDKLYVGMHKVEDFIGEMKFVPIRVESSEDLMEQVGLGIMKANFDDCDAEFDNVTCGCEFKCKTCNRMFCSSRALAGHQRIHGKPEIEVGCEQKKNHKCPICLKDFATIQALGGHKRVHMVNNSNGRPQKMVIKQEHSEISAEKTVSK